MYYLILLYVKTPKKRLFSSKNTGLHSDALSLYIYIDIDRDYMRSIFPYSLLRTRTRKSKPTIPSASGHVVQLACAGPRHQQGLNFWAEF